MGDFLTEFRCGWPYSEEGIESAHNWIKLFRERMAHFTGFKIKSLNFANMWVANQSEISKEELKQLRTMGRKRAFAPSPNQSF